MPKKEIINLGTAAPNANLSPATRFGNLVFVAANGTAISHGRSARTFASRRGTCSRRIK